MYSYKNQLFPTKSLKDFLEMWQEVPKSDLICGPVMDYSLGTPAFNPLTYNHDLMIDRQLTIHQEQHTGPPELWLSAETEIYGWAEWVWRMNETDNLKKTKV